MQHPQLKADKREILGKKVKKLRREGIMPANIYGKGLASLAIQVDTKAFDELFEEVGETGLVDLMVDGKKHPVLIKNVNMDFRTYTPLHADFYQVNLKEKVKTMVPIELTGEAQAVTEKVGILLPQLSEVEVEALPEELPENIVVDVSRLATIDEQITVGDIPVLDGVSILTDPTVTIVKIGEAVVEEPEPEVAPETEEGTPAEGEVAEGSTEEPQKESAEESSQE